MEQPESRSPPEVRRANFIVQHILSAMTLAQANNQVDVCEHLLEALHATFEAVALSNTSET